MAVAQQLGVDVARLAIASDTGARAERINLSDPISFYV